MRAESADGRMNWFPYGLLEPDDGAGAVGRIIRGYAESLTNQDRRRDVRRNQAKGAALAARATRV